MLIILDVFMDSTTDFTVDASSVSPSGDGKVKAIITGPSGTKSESSLGLLVLKVNL